MSIMDLGEIRISFFCIIMIGKIKYKELKGQILNIAFVEPFVFMGWLFCFFFSAPS